MPLSDSIQAPLKVLATQRIRIALFVIAGPHHGGHEGRTVPVDNTIQRAPSISHYPIDNDNATGARYRASCRRIQTSLLEADSIAAAERTTSRVLTAQRRDAYG